MKPALARFVETFCKTGDLSARLLAGAIVDQVASFSGDQQHDDMPANFPLSNTAFCGFGASIQVLPSIDAVFRIHQLGSALRKADSFFRSSSIQALRGCS